MKKWKAIHFIAAAAIALLAVWTARNEIVRAADAPLSYDVLEEDSTLTVGLRVALPSKLAGKHVRWSSSNVAVLLVDRGIATAVAPGTAYLIAQYGTLRDSTLITVIPRALLAVANVTGAFSRMSYTTLGVDLTWDSVVGASGYEFKLAYDTATIAWNGPITGRTTYMTVPRNIGQSFLRCVRPVGQYNDRGPVTCAPMVAPDIDRVSLQLDSTTLTVGSIVNYCAYGWYQNRVIDDWPVVVTSSDTAVAKVTPGSGDAALCLNKLTPAQRWTLP